MKKDSEPQLKRSLNLSDVSLLVIGAVFGSGIFLTTGYIAESLPSSGWILAVWLIGGFITLAGALTFAELGAALPEAGGQYIYLREAYGPGAGFLYGWTNFLVIQCGGIAALAVGFSEYLGYYFPSLSNQKIILSVSLNGWEYFLSSGQLVAIGAIGLLTAVNYRGLRMGSSVQNMFTIVKIMAVALIVVLGLVIGRKQGGIDPSSLFSGEGMSTGLFFKHLGLALIAVMWTYDGWYSVSCTAGEIKNPSRNIPIGLFTGTISIISIYFMVNVVYLLALKVEDMQGVTRIGEAAVTSMFGTRASPWINATIMVAIFGCLSATVIYGPRVFYAMAGDGLFFRSMARVHPRFRTPHVAIIGQGVWSALLCLSGTYRSLYEYVVFALVLFFAATGLSVFILRRKRPDLRRPYRVWGYPVVPITFVLINLWIFLNTVISQPLKSGLGLLLIALGIPAYFTWKRRS